MQSLTFLTNDLSNSSYYKRIEDDFMGGLRPEYISYQGVTVRVYKPILMAMLLCKTVKVLVKYIDEFPDEETVIDGTQYVPAYVKGFLEGRAYFQKCYEVSADREYSDSYIKTIKDQFCNNGIVPWSGWYQPNALGSIGYEEIKELGYQAGILSEVELLAARNKAIRDAIEPCMHRKYSPAIIKYKPNYFTERPKAHRLINKIPNSKSGHKSKTDYPESGFDIYIYENYQQRDKLIKYLTDNYNNKRARYLVPMLYALIRLEAVARQKIYGIDQTEIYRALRVTFGDIGARSSIANALRLYEPEGANEKHKQEINKHYQQIKSFLEDEKLA
ncbi:hypothetical protein [Spirosoma sp. KNUC1025]|uniref:hypothetical protein n=1 Tax=Spirosoma sp. KNUC1025 TaxID=2894082 RepID=UPI0038674CF2|nr:hypothetical protein LN737_04535 [Spirosoma sp. KNUC1025]